MKRIAYQISAAIILCTVIMVLTFGVIIYFEAEQVLRKQANTSLQQILTIETQKIGLDFYRVQKFTEVLQSYIETSLELERAIENPTYISEYKLQLVPLINRLMESFGNESGWVLFNSDVIPGINTVSFTLEEGKFIREPEYDVVNDGYSNEEWWIGAIENGAHWTKPYYWPTWNADIISYSRPIIIENQLVAVTGSELFLNHFKSQLAKTTIYESGFVALLGPNDQWVYFPEAEVLEAQDKIIQIYKALQAQPEEIFFSKKDELLHPFTWKSLENGWTLFAIAKWDEMYADLQRISHTILFSICLVLPLATFIGILLSRAITHPLADLTLATEQLLDDDSNYLPPQGKFDEISKLATAFSIMRDKVRSTLAELTLSEAKHRSLIENADQLVFTLDIQGNLTMVNRKLKHSFGRECTNLIDQSFVNLFSKKEDKEFWISHLSEVCENRRIISHRDHIRDAEGKIHYMNTTLIPVGGVSGDVALLLGTSADITEIIEAQQKITALLENEKKELSMRVDESGKVLGHTLNELIEAEKMAYLGRLVTGVAHEMNTPIGTAITAASYIDSLTSQLIETMQKNALTHSALLRLQENLESGLEILAQNLDRTVTLINSFKSISVVQNTEPLGKTDLKKLINLSLSTFTIHENNNRVKVQLLGDDPILVTTYIGSITQIIHALMENAIIHAFTETPNPEVSISLSQTDTQVNIIFTDNGSGIAEPIQPEIYEPFFTTNRGRGSTGLGLSLVYNIVTQLLRGSISCSSRLGHGTTFDIWFQKNITQ